MQNKNELLHTVCTYGKFINSLCFSQATIISHFTQQRQLVCTNLCNLKEVNQSYRLKASSWFPLDLKWLWMLVHSCYNCLCIHKLQYTVAT